MSESKIRSNHPRRWKEVKRGSSRLLTYNVPESSLQQTKVALFDLDGTLIRYEKDILDELDWEVPLTITLQQGDSRVPHRPRQAPPVCGGRIRSGRDYQPEHTGIKEEHTGATESQDREGLRDPEV